MISIRLKLSADCLKLAALSVVALMSASDLFAEPTIKPQLLTDKKTYDGQPAMSKTADGTVWTAWVGYEFPLGDRVMVASKTKDGWSAPELVSTNYSQIVRPTICAAGNTLWAFWTETAGKDVARVVCSKRENGKWTAPERISGTDVSAQNQEAMTDGKKVFVTWQEFHKGQYDIVLREFSGSKWQKPVSVSDDKYDDWDPTIVRDSNGAVWVAWSTYRDGDYDVYLRRTDKMQKEIRLSARGEYDLHPTIAADQSGRVWVGWDSITVPRHGSSGGSTITGANKAKEGETEMNDPENPNAKPLVAQIRIVCLQDGKVSQIPKTSKALTPPAPYRLAHTALPKLSIDDNGNLWVGYRALFVDLPADKPKKKDEGKLSNADKRRVKRHAKRGPYWWDAFVHSFNGETWSQPQKLPNSDGNSEEMALVAASGGVEVAYQMEHRQQNAPAYKALQEHASAEEEDDHHHDYGKVLGSNGDVYVVSLPSPKGNGLAKAHLAARAVPDKAVKPRVARDAAHYDTKINGQKYTVLWGDLHKHSNISRCSSGNEPAPDDHYKYAHDICQYDFLAMSDHAEHTSDFNWWRIQKLADLYNIPGFFSVLYGYEWSASWPIGHHNVIWPSRPSPILRSNVEGTRNTKELCDTLAKSGLPALVIPHTMADPRMGTRWDYHDERFERLAEMFQACRGSYEYNGCPRQHVDATAKNCYYQDGLGKDYKLGTICSSDHGWGTAYAVVYATENSRQAAWQALHDRRCYGSTTYGLVLDFRMGGHFMGEEFSSEKPEEISVYVRGTAPIRQIDVLSDRKIIHTEGSLEKPIGNKEVRLTWKPESLPAGTSYYYVRVIQGDDEMAWSSPVWITNRSLKVSDAK